MVLVSVFCAQLLKCPVKLLRDRLNHPEDRALVLKHLIGRKVRTTYNDRNGLTKTFFIGGISAQGAAFLPAYGHLRNPFNINVAAHFYARHRIKLHFPYVPCIVERFSGGGEDRHYPMELLELIDDNMDIDNNNNWLGNLFTEIDDNDKSSTSSHHTSLHLILEDDDMDIGRNECSQDAAPSSYWVSPRTLSTWSIWAPASAPRAKAKIEPPPPRPTAKREPKQQKPTKLEIKPSKREPDARPKVAPPPRLKKEPEFPLDPRPSTSRQAGYLPPPKIVPKPEPTKRPVPYRIPKREQKIIVEQQPQPLQQQPLPAVEDEMPPAPPPRRGTKRHYPVNGENDVEVRIRKRVRQARRVRVQYSPEPGTSTSAQSDEQQQQQQQRELFAIPSNQLTKTQRIERLYIKCNRYADRMGVRGNTINTPNGKPPESGSAHH
ncbi:hypothetical protein niasHT_030029 [Heterodera trifolii]|uniref:PAZ domain-containing protein n=1 Tax=Heterodera trifolii TaxID=157864 RepID=A0ABD2JQE0_9BILA